MIFEKLISTKLILIVFELLLQVKNKSFWLKINWTNTIFQEFRHGNTIFIKQKWKEKKWLFCVINCESFYKCGCFVSGILLLNMLNSNRKRRKNTILCENILGKFIFHETKKWAVSDVNLNREPFRKCECFASGILLLNMLISKVEKWKKHNSAWILKGK